MALSRTKAAADTLNVSDEDLRASVGPNADVDIKYLQKVRERRHAFHQFVWTAFLLPLVWLAYRRFYLGIGLFLVAAVAIGFLPEIIPFFARFERHLGIALAVAVAATGKVYVIKRAARHAAKADEAGLTGEARRTFLADRGGTSWISALLAGIFTLGFAGWIFYLTQGSSL